MPTPRHWSDFPGRSRGMSECPAESEGEGAGIISMRLPNQCRPNTGRIQFFPILFCPCDVKHTASLHGFAVFDEALHNCLRQFKHHLVCIQALHCAMRGVVVEAARTLRGARAFVQGLMSSCAKWHYLIRTRRKTAGGGSPSDLVDPRS